MKTVDRTDATTLDAVLACPPSIDRWSCGAGTGLPCMVASPGSSRTAGVADPECATGRLVYAVNGDARALVHGWRSFVERHRTCKGAR